MMKKYAMPFFFGVTAAALCVQSAAAQADTLARKTPAYPNVPVHAGRVLPLKDTVPVLFGQQPGASLVQSYGIVYGDELRNTPVTTLENTLYGKLAGLYLEQFSLTPGDDAASASLRSAMPLIVIDGVPRSGLSVDPEQVASITILKDALGTAMYGMRGQNGVILVTTRHGYNGKKRISFTAQTAVQQMVKTPKFLNAYDYASLYNEALVNDGRQAVYSAADLEAWRSGSDPLGHPDVDWYNTVLKNQAGMQRYNLNVAGGNRISRYFVDLDYLNQQGYFKTDSRNTYPTNNFYKRYIFRSNVDVDLTRSTLMNLSVYGRIRNGNEPGARTDSIFKNILSTPNNAYPVQNFDGSLAGNNQYANNIYGMATRSGYRPTYNRNLSVDLSLRQRLDGLLQGLFVKGLVSFNSYYDEALNRSKSFAVYNVAMNPGVDTVINQIGSDGQQSNSSSITSQTRQAYTELQLGYDSTFGKHGVSFTGLYYRDSYTDGNVLPLVNSAFSARAAYNYDLKYLLEVTMAYSYNNMYSSSNRWGYFPAVGLGWNIARENWFRDAVPAISTLKLRGSYGLVGNSLKSGYYSYLQFFNFNGTYNLGNPATGVSTIGEAALANPFLTWEKARKTNIGLDVATHNDKLQFTAEYYVNKLSDLVMYRGTNASGVIGATLPAENLGRSTQRGLELSAAYHEQTGVLGYYVKGNITFARTRVDYMDEVNRRYSWNQRTGQPVGQIFGLVADGFYQSKEDVENSAALDGYNPVPGDIKYKDLNGDGTINVFDERAIGSDKPLIFYGLTAGISWKGIDLNMVWQGVGNRYINLNGSNTWEFLSNANGAPGQAMEHHLGRWTPATASAATYPRLSVNGNVNNHRTSTFWVKDASYLRLKTLELGYTLPQHWVRPLHLQSVRAFASGYNLLTFTPLDRVDPESYLGGYPNQRIINFGVNIQL